jgi:FAD:protein FMN transferase
MGSPCELALYLEESSAQVILAELRALISGYEAKYSRYKVTSELSRINSSAGSRQKVDDETAALLNYAEVLYQQSDGYFDITSGILRKIWNFKKPILPSRSERDAILPFVGWQKVRWEPPFLMLPKGMELDFGGIVKEYVADTVAALCRQKNIHHGLINLGGDIHVIGSHPGGKPWQVGIQHPLKFGKSIVNLEIFQGALATSGDYERSIVINNKRYSHLLNPFTAEAIETSWASVSVIASQCIVAGSYSTIALLKSANANEHSQWLEKSELAYLGITQNIELIGNIAYKKTPEALSCY